MDRDLENTRYMILCLFLFNPGNTYHRCKAMHSRQCIPMIPYQLAVMPEFFRFRSRRDTHLTDPDGQQVTSLRSYPLQPGPYISEVTIGLDLY